MAQELDVIELKSDRPDLGLEAGDRGAIVMLFDDRACEVEFVKPDGTTRVMATFELDDVAVVWRIADHRPITIRAAG